MFELTLTPGSVFAGRYRIVRGLKAGGMGAVFVAEHVATSQRVALKLMRPEIVASPELQSRFAQEARVSAMIGSRHVVAVTDAGIDGATPFLVMELLQGQELGDVIAARGALPPELVAVVLQQLAKGLDKAHAAGIIHRDLKPENVYLTRDEDGHLLVKILDFGIAKLVQGVSTTTVAGGTPQYMAPEQTRKSNLTAAVDIWALGLVVYRMLAGSSYWQADTLGELYGEILSPVFPPASQRSRALPAGFDAVFARCVNADPGARFASAGEMARAFAALLPGHSTDDRASAEALLGAPVASGNRSEASFGSHPSPQGTPPAAPLGESGMLGTAPTQLAAVAPIPIAPVTPGATKRRSVGVVVAVAAALLVLATALAAVFMLKSSGGRKTGKKPASAALAVSAPVSAVEVVSSVAARPPSAPPAPSDSPTPSATAAQSSASPTPFLTASQQPTAPPPKPTVTVRPQPPPADLCGHCNPGPNYCRRKCMERRGYR